MPNSQQQVTSNSLSPDTVQRRSLSRLQPALANGAPTNGYVRTPPSVHPISVVQRFMDGLEQRMISGTNEAGSGNRFQVLFDQVHWSPDLEVFTSGDTVVVRAALPELKPGTLKVELEDGVLCIAGERCTSDGASSPDGHELNGYVRRLTLPMDVLDEDIVTSVVNDALEISIPAN